MIQGECPHCHSVNQLELQYETSGKDRWQLHCITCSNTFPVTPDMNIKLPKNKKAYALPISSHESPMMCSYIAGTSIPAFSKITYMKSGL